MLSRNNISTDHNNNTDCTDHSDEDNSSIIKTNYKKIVVGFGSIFTEDIHHENEKHTINHALAKWIVTNLQPLYVLQNKSFIEFVHALNPYYELPSDKSVKLLKISKEQIDDNEQKFFHMISDTPMHWNSSYIAWKRLLQIKCAIKLMEVTMNADTNYNIHKDAIYLKSLMITEEE
ncbi:12579_t:CDS:2 [Cetraspora pellucida]|uniref:12579_t:CDS:1 n=1 Tax=Cetraspora pellucida TaxID=1433469 RepID=A0ACA9MAU6_9GLOM|nr:12579_t:CDS:2 [Cetraspora pellucida]